MKNTTTLYIFLVLLMLGISACGSDYLDINENPNAATRPPLNGLLASGSYSTAINQFAVSTQFTSYYVQYLASPNVSGASDTYEPASYGSWDGIYNTMTDLYDLINLVRRIMPKPIWASREFSWP